MPSRGAEKDELARGSAKESAAAGESGRVTLPADVAEKSGPGLSVLESGFVVPTCACDAQTVPSSRNADTNRLFMMCLSEGRPDLCHPHRYGKQHQGVCLP